MTTADALYRRHHRRLERHLERALPHVDRAAREDAAQIAWTRLLRRPDLLDDPLVYGWLRVTAVWEARRVYRDQRALSQIDDCVVADRRQDLERRVHARAVLASLGSTAQERRVALARVAGLRHDEIAQALDLSARQVQRSLGRVRAGLRAGAAAA